MVFLLIMIKAANSVTPTKCDDEIDGIGIRNLYKYTDKIQEEEEEGGGRRRDNNDDDDEEERHSVS